MSNTMNFNVTNRMFDSRPFRTAMSKGVSSNWRQDKLDYDGSIMLTVRNFKRLHKFLYDAKGGRYGKGPFETIYGELMKQSVMFRKDNDIGKIYYGATEAAIKASVDTQLLALQTEVADTRTKFETAAADFRAAESKLELYKLAKAA